MASLAHIGFWHVIGHVIEDILVAIYQPLLFSLLFSVVAMFFVMYANEHGWRPTEYLSQATRSWKAAFAGSALFRSEFFLVLFVVLVLFRTLLLRPMWLNPLSDVLGGWGLYDSDGSFTPEAIENFILFIPFSLLLSDVLHKGGGDEGRSESWVLKRASQAPAVFSLIIECLQLVLRLGTFQISDLFYNTVGGIVGAVIYHLVLRTRARRRGECEATGS